ncbi:MAG: LPXTG cell wall anchor domain-containing protein [Ilumatobacteraceae bacterium]
MNRNPNTRTRHFARLAVALGTGVITLAGAGQAFADTPVQPEQPLEVADGPECAPWSYDGLSWYFADAGSNSQLFQVKYADGVETCDEFVSLKIYTLAGPDAEIDDPGSSLQFSSGYPLSKIEQDTMDKGGEMSSWAANDGGVCSEFRISVGGKEIISQRVVDDCAELPLTDGDPGDPDPQPENPGDLTSGTPGPDQPDDGSGDGSGDGVDQGGELPHTGATSGALVALAAGLTLAGGAALAGSRRRANV